MAELGMDKSQTAEFLEHVDLLAEQQVSPADYFAKLLQLMVEFSGAHLGQIWQVHEGKLEVLVRVQSGSETSPEPQELEKASVAELFEAPAPALRYSSSDPGPQQCLMLIPLLNHERCFAVVSLATWVESAYAAEACLGMLAASAERISRSYVTMGYAEAHRNLARAEKAKTVITAIGQHLEMKPLAYEVANRLQKYLKADRVALGIRRGRSLRIKAVSNQAVFDRRSNVIRHLEKLGTQIAKTEEPLWHPNEEPLPPTLKKLVERCLEASDSLAISVLPIFAAAKRLDNPEDLAETIEKRGDKKECVGVLILEGIQTPLQTERVQRRWRRVEQPVSDAIANARKYDGLFLMPAWRALGSFADLYRGHTRRKALLITALIGAIFAALGFIQADFKLRGEGVIQPISRQHIYAETDGTIHQLLVADGDSVRADQLLLSLENPQLAARVAELEGKLRESLEQLKTTTIQRVTRSFDNEQEERELVRNASTLEARIKGQEKQLALLHRSQRQLEVKSPIDGTVVTWDIDQRLQGRPVKPGERLMTIAVPTGKWEIELRIPDKRAGYLLERWQDVATSHQQLAVSFVLTSNPSQVAWGEVIEVAPSANVDDKENESVVRVRVQLDNEEFHRLGEVRPGTTVIGHVHCGRASLGYCKLYEFFDWTKRIWFRFVA